MDKRAKRKWVKALLSGKYRQGTGQLGNEELGYCCLGVLGKVCGIPFVSANGFLSNDVLPRAAQRELANLNDDEAPFELIAGLIDAAL